MTQEGYTTAVPTIHGPMSEKSIASLIGTVQGTLNYVEGEGLTDNQLRALTNARAALEELYDRHLHLIPATYLTEMSDLIFPPKREVA